MNFDLSRRDSIPNRLDFNLGLRAGARFARSLSQDFATPVFDCLCYVKKIILRRKAWKIWSRVVLLGRRKGWFPIACSHDAFACNVPPKRGVGVICKGISIIQDTWDRSTQNTNCHQATTHPLSTRCHHMPSYLPCVPLSSELDQFSCLPQVWGWDELLVSERTGTSLAR